MFDIKDEAVESYKLLKAKREKERLKDYGKI